MKIKKVLGILNLIAVFLMLKFGALLLLWEAPREFKLIAFDVGQGDALMLTIPGSTIQILIDGGSDNGIVKKLERSLPVGDDLVDVVILTHSHEDHVGGLPYVLENFKVGLVVDSGASNDSPDYEKMMEQIEALSIPYLYAVRGEKIKIGPDFELKVIHPFFSVGAGYKNLNNASVSALVSFKGNKMLFVGDLEEEGEREVLSYLDRKDQYWKLQADLVKIGHHGSKTATSDNFLDSVKPRRAIISCGKDNQFGHPHEETVSKLEVKSIEILRTDKLGDIEITF